MCYAFRFTFLNIHMAECHIKLKEKKGEFMKKVNIVCPYCGKSDEVYLTTQKINIEIKNQLVEYKEQVYNCKACGEEFEDGKFVTYPFKQLDELELAYAVTVHKSQGSEYPAIVIPLLQGPRPLMNRNLLYTAVTRAKKCVTIVGDENVFYQMIQNENEQRRYSGLVHRMMEVELT